MKMTALMHIRLWATAASPHPAADRSLILQSIEITEYFCL
jgi:hypothetical protein